jgi:streptogramin lyase
MTNRIARPAFLVAVVLVVLLGGGVARSQSRERGARVALPWTPAGIAVDGQHLWVLEAEAGRIHRLEMRSGEVDRSFAVDVANPRGLAFDGQKLWVGSDRGGAVTAIDPEKGRTLRSIQLGEGSLAACESIEGLAWDGQSLWVACYGGFCSTYNQCDPDTGRVTRSVYANCNPRGIATDGKTIWSICHNGDKFPSKIDARPLAESDQAMQTSRRFLLDIEGRTPVGLAQDRGVLWYADRATRTAYAVPLDDLSGGKAP